MFEGSRLDYISKREFHHPHQTISVLIDRLVHANMRGPLGGKRKYVHPLTFMGGCHLISVCCVQRNGLAYQLVCAAAFRIFIWTVVV